ncbi:reverse transcriptase, partial [Phytophthora megakarya]
MVERFGASLASKISDASDWETAEGYITALPHLLYDKLQPYSQAQRRLQPCPRPSQQAQHDQRQHVQQTPRQEDTVPHRHPSTTSSRRRRQRRTRRGRPPRVTRHHRDHRLDEALDELHVVERRSPSNRSAVNKARRRVGLINAAIAQQRLRHQFDKDEKACVDGIFTAAREKRAMATTPTATTTTATTPTSSTASVVDASTCPIPGEELHRFFTAVNTPSGVFEPMAPVGAHFRSALARLPAARHNKELLTDHPTPDEIEDQLQRVRGSFSPGLDGVGYDIYNVFATQLLPALHATFKCCWQHRRGASAHKKGDRLDPANWRPICLQQTIYKLYAGVLARRFTRWLDANDRHATAQKGFRAMNGCGEHNFLAASLVDQARRKRQELHVVWYDFANAFGSVPHDLLWAVLQRMGVPAEFVDCCRGLYANAAFT